MLLPPDPTTLHATAYRPAAHRTLRPFGATAELVLLPERKERPGRPGAERAPFAPDRVPLILAAELQWRGAGLALTPNRFPFAAQQCILWSDPPTRDHREPLLAVLFAWNDRQRGTALGNTVGAAASIARAHAHATTERIPFLHELRERALPAAALGWLPPIDGVTYVQKDVPFWLLGVRGPALLRAAAIAALLRLRMTAAINFVDTEGTAWLYPRSAIEAPVPHFPAALGAAEVWGRWCYVDEAPFAAASERDLEAALLAAGCPFAANR